MSHQQLKGCSPLITLPSVVVSKILSYLTWHEKLATANAIGINGMWAEALRSTEAWNFVRYGPELEENIYFAEASRKNFAACVKQYGNFMRSVCLTFGYSIANSSSGFSIDNTGEHILKLLQKRCTNLATLLIEQEIPEGCHDVLSYYWPTLVGIVLDHIAVHCKSLKSISLYQPVINWSSDDIFIFSTNNPVAMKVTELELTFMSLLNHDGKLHLLKNLTGLKKLTIRREKVNNEILLHLVRNSLQELTLYQEEELPYEDQKDLGEDFWAEVIKICPKFKTDLILRCVVVLKILFPPNMPLRNLVLDFLANVMTKGIVDHISDCYKDTLQRFTYTNSFLENQEMGDTRLPTALISLAQKCSKLETIEYGFPLSSSSILLIAQSRKLKNLVVPSVEVTYENDLCMDNSTPSKEEYNNFLKLAGSNKKNLESTVSHILGYQWTLLDGPLKVNERIKF